MKAYLQRFKNSGTIIALASAIGLLLVQFGVSIDLEWLDYTVKILCSVGVLLGVLNNPTTPGTDLPIIESKEVE